MLYEIPEDVMMFLEHIINEANIKGKEVPKFIKLINALKNPIPDEVVNNEQLDDTKGTVRKIKDKK